MEKIIKKTSKYELGSINFLLSLCNLGEQLKVKCGRLEFFRIIYTKRVNVG
jgi:hypothetical protein